MSPARLASVLCFIAGLSAAPLLFAQLSSGLSGEQLQQLEEIRKRMEPAPYVPANEPGCKRWRGKAYVSRDVGLSVSCVGMCAVELVDADGVSARWQVTGERCSRGSAPRAAQVVNQAPAQAGPAAPIHAPSAPSVSTTKPAPARGQAKNYAPGDEPYQGPPPGYRAALPKR